MRKKSSKSKATKTAENSLISAARTIGATLGSVAATAGEAAKDLETFTSSVRKKTLRTTRRLYKRVKKTVSAAPAKQTRRKKSGAKKAGA